MCKVAFITGITGQDGSYLAEFLLEKNYKIYGLVRKTTATHRLQYIDHIVDKLVLRYGDLGEGNGISHILREIKDTYPDLERLEVYNYGALTHVGLSFNMAEYSGDINGLGVLRVLEAIRLSGYADKIRFLQASTSELFGKVHEIPQTENTAFHPMSPYSIGKLYGYWITRNYREAYDIFSVNSICFNHESSRRDEIFVTRKITKGLSDIIHNRKNCIILGNIDASRDWGHAKDYVRGMWMMMQHHQADDFVISSNETYGIRQFVEKSFGLKGFDIKWKGEGLNEVGYDANTGRELIFISEKYMRPSEVEHLHGNSAKARETLGWIPEYTFDDLVKDMVDHDCAK